jgi:hypothetical protein
VSADHGADGDEGALRERREPRDADGEGEADRGTGEVEPVGEVGSARLANEERGECGDQERRDGDRPATPP